MALFPEMNLNQHLDCHIPRRGWQEQILSIRLLQLMQRWNCEHISGPFYGSCAHTPLFPSFLHPLLAIFCRGPKRRKQSNLLKLLPLRREKKLSKISGFPFDFHHWEWSILRLAKLTEVSLMIAATAELLPLNPRDPCLGHPRYRQDPGVLSRPSLLKGIAHCLANFPIPCHLPSDHRPLGPHLANSTTTWGDSTSIMAPNIRDKNKE